MNYLAHSVISLEIDKKMNENTLYGNFTGDFYKGKVEKIKLQENLKSGIILHRLIDKISDREENFLSGLLKEKFGMEEKLQEQKIKMIEKHWKKVLKI